MTRKLALTLILWTVILSALAFTFVAEAAPACENVPGFVAVQADSLRVRSGPGTTYDTLRFVGRDDILPVLDGVADAGWWRVCPEGYVSAAYVRFVAAAPTAIITPRATPTRIMLQRVYCMAGSVTQTPVEPGMQLIECQSPGVKP